MSTLEEALATRHRLSHYHVYHEEENVCITPYLDLKKEFGYNKKRHRLQAEDYASKHRRSDEANSYFVHQPALFFRDPPRILYRGSHKRGTPVSLIHSSSFWREWNIQLGSNLADVIDPRGLVRWEHRSNPDNRTAGDPCALKGYKVRTWRVWGESGKTYHRQVNARRKELREEGLEEKPPEEPARAEDAVQLKWSSPLSKARRYHFEYAGITFSWEGTRDLPASETWSRRLMPLNHLKLTAQVPGKEKVFLGLYVSNIASKKFGELSIFDSALSKLLHDSGNPSLAAHSVPVEKGVEFEEESDTRTTRVYELVISTAMCMIIGEWEKRMTIWIILMAVAQAGNNANIAFNGGGGS
ncbi:uncharacterized protein N7459_002316 [Penicillium hispanicum]|uniref:uncharacterized protein n=1 Tax=Penicillium hispanicum TaxID=1080232 RepID=UPI002541D628|nr:uncharacterized protein N7459_002316 [Penicillium hispanicum]KAJ5591947.1 hypothetical protein N7459_002316 [Penicillium hispanicum]